MWEKTAMTLTLLTCCSVGSNLSGSQKKSSVSGSWRCWSICQSFLNVNEYRWRITFRLPWRNSSFCSEKTRRESEGFWKKIIFKPWHVPDVAFPCIWSSWYQLTALPSGLSLRGGGLGSLCWGAWWNISQDAEDHDPFWDIRGRDSRHVQNY